MKPEKFLEIMYQKRKFFGIKYYDFLDKAEITEGIYKRRIKDPGKFTLEEAGKIMEALHFTEEERRMVFSENS